VSLVGLIATLVIIGLVMWAVNQIPMAPNIRTILNVAVAVFVVLWLLQSFTGLGLPSIRLR